MFYARDRDKNYSQELIYSVQRTPSNRSTTSTVSSLMSLDPILDEDQASTADLTHEVDHHLANNIEDENRLEFGEHFDYKQDRSLSSVRLVCKNATKVLRRKDSSGSILKDGIVKKADFTYCFNLCPKESDSQLVLEPGRNNYTLKIDASSNVGSFCLNQLSIQVLNGKLDLLTDRWPQAKRLRYAVITEAHSFSVSMPAALDSSDKSSEQGNLWAGFCQEIDLNIFTGSHHLSKVQIHSRSGKNELTKSNFNIQDLR